MSNIKIETELDIEKALNEYQLKFEKFDEDSFFEFLYNNDISWDEEESLGYFSYENLDQDIKNILNESEFCKLLLKISFYSNIVGRYLYFFSKKELRIVLENFKNQQEF